MDLGAITGTVTGAITFMSEVAPTWGLVVSVLIIVALIFFTLRFFLDIAVDLWKLPFAIGVDVLDLMAFSYYYLDVVAAGLNIMIFWMFAKRGHFLCKIFGFVAAAEALVGMWIFPQWAWLANILPTSTILMFIAIKVD